MRPLYIFDLDGTLANIDHRVHILNSKEPDKWRIFYGLCDKDTPIRSMLDVLSDLESSGGDIWIFTGRSEEVRQKTEDWLQTWAAPIQCVMMRPEGDHQPDTTLKKAWLDGMDGSDIRRLVCVFEDRSSVVDMWRENGITCCQVAKGDF